MDIHTIETPCLGNRSYLLTSDGAAAIVDPPRDVERMERLLAEHGAELALVLETHRHADYVSGGLELARRHRAEYVVPPGEPEPSFSHLQATDGTELAAGSMAVRVLATPGHTPHHVAFVFEAPGSAPAVCTGGSLLHGSVGRTDLSGPARTVALARQQWESARRLHEGLPPHTRLLPTHGFGSLCAAAPAADSGATTLGGERAVNPVFLADREEFVRDLVAGYGPVPRHYARLPMVNAAGPLPYDANSAPSLVAGQLPWFREAGHWLVDIRDRRSFAAAHLAGTVNVELSGAFTAYLPWLLPAGSGVVLVGPHAAVREASAQLALVGIDRPMGVLVTEPDWWDDAPVDVRSYPVCDFADFTARGMDPTVLLDVRSDGEWSAGHVRAARHVSLPHLAVQLDPAVRGLTAGAAGGGFGETWVHCAAGFRAAIAASLLDAAGVPVTLLDSAFQAAVDAGLTVAEDREDRAERAVAV